jgi:enoyl-CoA hydratase/carnithine racemase
MGIEMAEDQILYRKENGIGIVTFNRPEKLNACTFHMYELLGKFEEEIKKDDEVRAVILTGNGRAFCAGADLQGPESGLKNPTATEEKVEASPRRIRLKHSTLDRNVSWGMLNIPKPTIAAINGAAVGVGAEYCLHCDFRIAGESARWGQVFALRGWVPDTAAGTYLLPKIVGMANAMELLFSGEIIDAKEMLRIGLVSKVVPNDQLLATAMEFAKKVTRGAPLAIHMDKELVYRSWERSIDEHIAANGSAFSALNATEDHVEGVKSFLEKREPKWKGR